MGSEIWVGWPTYGGNGLVECASGRVRRSRRGRTPEAGRASKRCAAGRLTEGAQSRTAQTPRWYAWRPMSLDLRRFVALLLAAVLVTVGSGVGGSFASEIQHDLGMEASLDSGPGPQSERGGACDHGCAGHLSVHLLSITEPQLRHLVATASGEPAMEPIARPASSPLTSFFRPPRFSLA